MSSENLTTKKHLTTTKFFHLRLSVQNFDIKTCQTINARS